MDERPCPARKGRNFAFINKLVTEIGHTSKREVGGATWTDRGGPEVNGALLSPITAGARGETEYSHCLAPGQFFSFS